MKLKRIIAIPFALVADVVTFNYEHPYTQRLFEAERREQELREFVELGRIMVDLVRAARSGE